MPAYRSFLSDLYGLCNRSSLAHSSLDDFMWAMLMVQTRAFALKAETGGEGGGDGGGVSGAATSGQYAFVPFADFMNHAADPNLAQTVR